MFKQLGKYLRLLFWRFCLSYHRLWYNFYPQWWQHESVNWSLSSCSFHSKSFNRKIWSSQLNKLKPRCFAYDVLWCCISSLQTKAVHWFICFPSSHCSWQLLKSYLINLTALKTNYITEWFNFVLIVMENGLLAIHAAYKDLQVFICLLLRRIYHDKLPSEFKKVRVLSFDNQTINSFKLSR